MAQLNILLFPDPRLRKQATPIAIFDAALARLVDDMFDTMYENQGIGLAATQVNVHQRLFVLDIPEDHTGRLVFINPTIDRAEGSSVREEGCLSIPDIRDDVTRPAKITVSAQDVRGQRFTLTLEGLFAACVQHEIDHLNGKLFIDYLSPLKRERIEKKLRKRAKLATPQ